MINRYIPKIDQIADATIKIKRIIGVLICRNFKISTTINATKIGHMQYPKIDTDWKYDIFPPSTLILNVTITAPKNTENINTINVVESIKYLNSYCQ